MPADNDFSSQATFSASLNVLIVASPAKNEFFTVVANDTNGSSNLFPTFFNDL